MREQVKEFLQATFTGMYVDLGPAEQNGRRISGVLVWSGFEEMSISERQDAVWDALRDHFAEKSAEISTLITMTPKQYGELSLTKD